MMRRVLLKLAFVVARLSEVESWGVCAVRECAFLVLVLLFVEAMVRW